MTKTMEPQKSRNSPGPEPEVAERKKSPNSKRRKESVVDSAE